MLAGVDGIQFVEVHQKIVRQGHLLIELIRQVQVVEIILAQLRWQQAMKEGSFATTLSTNQCWYAFITMKGVHLEPVGHSRQQPRSQISLLLGGEAGQTTEHLADVVFAVPRRQLVQVVADRIMYGYILRMYELYDLRLRTAFFTHLFLLSPADNTIKRLLGQRAPVLIRRGCKLYLPVQYIATEKVIFIEKQLDCERGLEGSIHSTPCNGWFLFHRH